jgi:hypothetical protein
MMNAKSPPATPASNFMIFTENMYTCSNNQAKCGRIKKSDLQVTEVNASFMHAHIRTVVYCLKQID